MRKEFISILCGTFCRTRKFFHDIGTVNSLKLPRIGISAEPRVYLGIPFTHVTVNLGDEKF